jgi:hypothetical protein
MENKSHVPNHQPEHVWGMTFLLSLSLSPLCFCCLDSTLWGLAVGINALIHGFWGVFYIRGTGYGIIFADGNRTGAKQEQTKLIQQPKASKSHREMDISQTQLGITKRDPLNTQG